MCPKRPIPLERVIDHARTVVAAASVSRAQHRLLSIALDGLARSVQEQDQAVGFVPVLDLPLEVYAAIIGAGEPAIPLAAACGFVHLGLDLFDDLADGDCPPEWAEQSGPAMTLAAATLLAALPPLVIGELPVSPERRGRMMQRLAQGLLRMSAGQQTDIDLTGAREIDPAAVEASVIGKSGEQLATYCALAAEMAGAAVKAVELWAEFGREIGAAVQLASDCHDLLVDSQCRDLRHGSRTLPIAAHLARLAAPARADFLDLLRRAQGEAGARRMVRDRLIAAGEIRRVLFDVQLRFVRARGLLDRVPIRDPGRARLLAGIAAMAGGGRDPSRRSPVLAGAGAEEL